jgi:hypothetical protein
VILQFFVSYCILMIEVPVGVRVGEFEEFCSWFSVSSPSLKRKNAKTVQQTRKRTSGTDSQFHFYHQLLKDFISSHFTGAFVY